MGDDCSEREVLHIPELCHLIERGSAPVTARAWPASSRGVVPESTHSNAASTTSGASTISTSFDESTTSTTCEASVTSDLRASMRARTDGEQEGDNAPPCTTTMTTTCAHHTGTHFLLHLHLPFRIHFLSFHIFHNIA